MDKWRVDPFIIEIGTVFCLRINRLLSNLPIST
jgi:hypothetical protein